MEDRETARMRKYGESKTSRIMMATIPHVTSGLGLRKFQADAFLLTRVYIDIPRRLRDAVRRKRHEKWRTNCWFLLHDNAPAHRSVLGKDFSAKKNVTTVKHPPYSPHLTSANFHLFPQLKSALKNGVTVMLLTSLRMRRTSWKRFQKIGFQQCF